MAIRELDQPPTGSIGDQLGVDGFGAVADLDGDVPTDRGRTGHKRGITNDASGNQQVLLAPNDDRGRGRLDINDVAGGLRGNPQSLALADREVDRSLVVPDDVAGFIHDRAGLRHLGEVVPQEGSVVAGSDKAEILAVRLVGGAQTKPCRVLATSGLVISPTGSRTRANSDWPSMWRTYDWSLALSTARMRWYPASS